jgi:hypothetical protein
MIAVAITAREPRVKQRPKALQRNVGTKELEKRTTAVAVVQSRFLFTNSLYTYDKFFRRFRDLLN